MISHHISPDGRYKVVETHGLEDGIRYRITEERYIVDEKITFEKHDTKPITATDDELEQAFQEIEHMQELIGQR